METNRTKELKLGIWNYTKKRDGIGCFEVTIGHFGNERVDYITYDSKGIWRCYEVKISKADFHSKNHNTFVGNFNYYVMPRELFIQVKEEIPKGIGVFISENDQYQNYPDLLNAVHAKKRNLSVDEQILKNSMIRSLYREAEKQIENENKHFQEANHG